MVAWRSGSHAGHGLSLDTVGFPVRANAIHARCIASDNASASGPLPANARGTVSVSHQGRTLELAVRVAHAANGGIEFLYESDEEREAVAHLVASLSSSRTFGPTLVS